MNDADLYGVNKSFKKFIKKEVKEALIEFSKKEQDSFEQLVNTNVENL